LNSTGVETTSQLRTAAMLVFLMTI